MTKTILAFFVLVSGCAVDLEVEEVRLSYKNVEVKGIPGNGKGAAKHAFAFDDLSALQTLVDAGADISFVEAELHATSGVDDMSFVDKLQINIAETMLYGCDGTCDIRGRDIAMTPDKKHRANDYVSAGSLQLDFDLEGHLPGNKWTLDFDVVLSAELAYALDPRQ
jgi:hypothetical protein